MWDVTAQRGEKLTDCTRRKASAAIRLIIRVFLAFPHYSFFREVLPENCSVFTIMEDSKCGNKL